MSEKFLHYFYPDNVEGERVKKCEECLNKTTLNVFSFHQLPNYVYLHLTVYLLLKLRQKQLQTWYFIKSLVYSPLPIFSKRTVWRQSLQEQLQPHQVEKAKVKSAQPLNYAVLEINTSD